jgi:hypothetical protein
MVTPGFAAFLAQPMACWRSAPTTAGQRAAKPVALLLFSLLLSTCLLLSAEARTRSASAVLDRDYASALAAANRFLAAWQAQDRENGLVMLTEAAKQHVSEDRLEEFFSPGTDAAYEISRGRKMDSGRYVFPVTLFEAGHRARPRVSQMIVVESSQDDWAVDRLP